MPLNHNMEALIRRMKEEGLLPDMPPSSNLKEQYALPARSLHETQREVCLSVDSV